MRSYKTVDKTGWGDGPWQDEPDKISWTDDKTGLPCLVVRNRMGAWCGYVGVAPEHPFFERNYEDPPVEVHGGLTYSDHCAEGPEETSICHVPNPGEPDHVWWFGFDCAHHFDRVPAFEARNKELFCELGLDVFERTYKTVAYVKSEVENLAVQLARIGASVE